MKKSKIIIFGILAIVLMLSTLTLNTLAEKPSIISKILMRDKMSQDFEVEHDKLLKGKVPVTEKEINESAAAGDRLKEKGKEIQKINEEIQAEEGVRIPSKEEILSEINLGISMTEEGIDNFLKYHPGKSATQSLNSRNESNLKQLETLKQLKDDLTNDKISLEDAWNKVLEIRDGKKQ